MHTKVRIGILGLMTTTFTCNGDDLSRLRISNGPTFNSISDVPMSAWNLPNGEIVATGNGTITAPYNVTINAPSTDNSLVWTVRTLDPSNTHLGTIVFVAGNTTVAQFSVGGEGMSLSGAASTIGSVEVVGHQDLGCTAVAIDRLGNVKAPTILLAGSQRTIFGSAEMPTCTIESTNGPINIVRAGAIGTSNNPVVIRARAQNPSRADIALVQTIATGAGGTNGQLYALVDATNRIQQVSSLASLFGSITSGGTLPIQLVQGQAGIGASGSPLVINAPALVTLRAGAVDAGDNPLSAGDMYLDATLTGQITRMRTVRFNNGSVALLPAAIVLVMRTVPLV